MTPVVSASPLAERSANCLVGTPSKKQPAPEPKTAERKARTAEEALYSGEQGDLEDLISVFKGLALDDELDEGERMKRMAQLMDMGDEATKALEEQRGVGPKVAAVGPENEGGEKDMAEEETDDAEEEAEEEEEEEEVQRSSTARDSAFVRDTLTPPKGWWQSLKAAATLSWKPAFGSTAQIEADSDASDDEFADDVLIL